MVADAIRLWKEVPLEAIPAAVDEALIQVGDYALKIGSVAKCYRELSAPKPLELGTGGRQYAPEALEQMAEFDAYWKSLTEAEQKAETEKRLQVCREAGAKLVGGVG